MAAANALAGADPVEALELGDGVNHVGESHLGGDVALHVEVAPIIRYVRFLGTVISSNLKLHLFKFNANDYIFILKLHT